jgi:predicted metal-dependent enzyme (double-stranded beta helix superfamily)
MARFSRRQFLAATAGIVAAGAAYPQGSDSGTPAHPGGGFSLDRFLEELKRANREADRQAAVHEVIARAVAEPSDVVRALGEPTKAGIHTLHHGKDLTVLNVVWAPLMVLLPHNHNMWATIGVYGGREDNITWERSGPVIEAAGAASLSEKEVFDLPDTAIHSVTNPIRRMTGAIHVYGGDFFAPGRSEWDSESLRERPFNLEAARETFREANERFEGRKTP